MQLNDGRFTICVNSTSKENGISKELTSLFTYMIDSQIDENDSFLTELEKEISILNREDGEWRRQIMRLDEKIALEKEEAAEKALAEGIELGQKDTKLEIAKNLKTMNYPIEEILKVTGLTLEEVDKL